MVAKHLGKLKKQEKDGPGAGKGGQADKKPVGPGDVLPPTANTIAGPTEGRCKCGEFSIVFRSAFSAARDFAITIVNLGDCPIGAQIYTGVEDGKPKKDPNGGSAMVNKNASTSLAGSVPGGGGFLVLCEGDGKGDCRFYWRIDKV